MNFERLYINGEWVSPQSTERIKVENPASMYRFAAVPVATDTEVDAACRAAADAAWRWQESPLAARLTICEKMLAQLLTRKAEIVDIEIQELGAPSQMAEKVHFDFQVERMRTFMRLAQEIEFREELEHSTLYREPVGVVAAITPWNYPLGQVVQKIMPAILMGNTVILKPSQHTPLSVYYLVDAFHQAGLPKGVLNLVTGRGGDVGNVLASHPLVDMVSFTGSTTGGIEVGKHGLDSVKKIHLELGGKSPCVILPDADIDQAIRACFNSLLLNCGQTCSALSRLLIPEDQKEAIETRLVEILQEYPVGDPREEGTKIGPLASEKQFTKVKKYIETGLAEGARMLTGSVPTEPIGGYYVQPVIFTDVTNDMQIAQEEIFGPVLCVITYKDLPDALHIANDTIYGLNAAVHGPFDEAVAFARRIKSGNVYINDSARDVTAPFGGYKMSGIGREGGIEGILEFTQSKVLFDHDA
ncbi:MAG: aldehyde dehydrogenase family protein [Negativicoccus succinicivorans]|uniref:aldehyde dehydrogenase family protein n=1 Tax=Negativicoccus succinicivorans TaxID=620903 RepID=UPI0003D66436|nr:aldehyde dehydrogenase family protein [Negativicoccus succinicivorans]ETJ15625.1 MAG: Aldehyde dehydrogenase (NAD) family protein [Veillonella sp. DORA_A_3_16_22]MBS5889584.1 aldehyde dehydrogenase family protein [Negativicoccus succinicivorans]MBS5917094.1 aldehyde dehydrogenase family protein [Negativicoccus succinicivorans]MDU0986288.1 aldehyde dehydrogenase family protein [Negativicoccus succinicivorans]MDU1065573.1 aldehyde dehydrogenase family protein [Negativicoccus succinicivorans]